MPVRGHFKSAPAQKIGVALPTPSDTGSLDSDWTAQQSTQLHKKSRSPSRTTPLTLSSTRKRWSKSADRKLLQLMLLRQLFPERNDITWQSIAQDITDDNSDKQLLSSGRVCSRFFTLMHDTAHIRGISHKNLVSRLALHPGTAIHLSEHRLSSQIPSQDGQRVPSLRTASQSQILHKFDMAAKTAEAREAVQAKALSRPDVSAQQRAAENLRGSKFDTRAAANLAIDQRLARVPILTDPIPTTIPQPTPATCSKPARSQHLLPNTQSSLGDHHSQSQQSTQTRQSSKQLETELQLQLWRDARKCDKYRRKAYERQFTEQPSRRSPKQIYLSAIEHNARNQKTQKFYILERQSSSHSKKRCRSTQSKKVDPRTAKNVSRDRQGFFEKGNHDKVMKRRHSKTNQKHSRCSKSLTDALQMDNMFPGDAEQRSRFERLKERVAKKQKSA